MGHTVSQVVIINRHFMKRYNVRIFQKTAPIGYSCLLGCGTLFLFLLALSGCQPTTMGGERQEIEARLPYFLTRIDQSNYGKAVIAGARDSGRVAPNGLMYLPATNGLYVLRGPEQVGIVDIPGKSPRDIAIDQKSGLVYVTDRMKDHLHVISGTEIISTITVSPYPHFVVVHPENGDIYVTTNVHSAPDEGNFGFHNEIVTIRDGEVLTPAIYTGRSADFMFIHPVDQQLYIGQAGNDKYDLWPFVIIEDNQIITQTYLGPKRQVDFHDIVADEETGEVYVMEGRRIVWWDRQGQITSWEWERDHMFYPKALAIDSSRDLLYFAAIDQVGVMKDGEFLTYISVPNQVYDVAYDKRHDYLYALSHYPYQGHLTVIRGTEVITTYELERGLFDYITVDEANEYIYISGGVKTLVFSYPDETDASNSLWYYLQPLLKGRE